MRKPPVLFYVFLLVLLAGLLFAWAEGCKETAEHLRQITHARP